MPDGVTLATDVWRPLFDGTPRPVLLRRTPYGRALDLNVAQAVVGAGYVLVSQDVRGRGDSKGTFTPFFDDKVDGKATIEWAAKQPWSNGAVATYSNSAEGIVQYMAMADDPAGLRCAHVGMPTHDLYEGMFPGGVWRAELGTAWLTGLGAAGVVDLWKSHEVHDAYWNAATLSTSEMASIDHPVFIMGGLFDIFAPSEVRALRELQTHAAPSVRGDMFLILGPWTHGGIGLRGQGQLLFPEDVVYTQWANELLDYAKWCTSGGPLPAFAQVRYYLMEVTDQTAVDPADNVTRVVASGAWRSTSAWPPPESSPVRLVAHPDGLRGEGVAGAPSLSIPVDPAAPLASRGGGNLTTAAGPYDQAELDRGPNVLTLASEPVTEITELVGSPRARLWVSSATSDLDVIVRLEVLTPMGKAIAVTDGALRGRFAAGFSALEPLVPGEPTLFDVALGPVALRLSPGYAVRIAVSGTSSPRYEPGPNTATPLSARATPVPTTLTLHRDAAHPSELVLPLLAGALPGARPVVEPAPDAGTGALDAGVASDAGDGGPGARADAGLTGADATPSSGTDGAAAPAADPAPKRDHAGCACSVREREGAGGAPTDLGAWTVFALAALRRRFGVKPRTCARDSR